MRALPVFLGAALALLPAACAAPPLALYTLEPPEAADTARPLGSKAAVIEIRRVAVPDYLDTQDILVRNGTTLVRSARGRWASRLSLEVTHDLTALLAARRPEALVTSQPQVEPPSERLFITISTLDVTTAGAATLEADWTSVPRNPAQPPRLQRVRFTTSGPVATDHDVVVLVQALLGRLADAIGAGMAR